jgi:glycogen synthase
MPQAQPKPGASAGTKAAARPKLRVAFCAWEIGRAASGLGTKIGGLGAVVEELPPELVKAADRQGLDLEVETLSPCFAHYDKSRLTPLDLELPVTLEGRTFPFRAYQHVFTERITFAGGSTRDVRFKMIYFWDPWQLHWTRAQEIYPDDPVLGAKLYSAVAQAMARYIRQGDFQTVHLHDYHVGLVPFFLGDEYLRQVPIHLTIHNASYQGITPLAGGGYASLDRLGLPGERLFHQYFDFFDNLNLLKACMLKVHETGGKITTVSGDLEGTWGYAAELRLGHRAIHQRAWAQKGAPPVEVFVPNRHLDLFEKIPVAGITNGLRDRNRPEQMPELKASTLKAWQAQRRDRPFFANPKVQAEMLARDHSFDFDHLEVKAELRKLLYLECFGHEIWGFPVLLTAVGRLVDQKNFGLIADIIPRTLEYDNQAKFIILANAPDSDRGGKDLEARFRALAGRHPGQVCFNHSFNPVLAKLIFAGGDFTLIPSRFEPCGLTDYEAALAGAITIGHHTGGLPKVRHCGYLYEWLDLRDAAGEANAFFRAIQAALSTYRHDYARHRELMRTAMALNAGWDASAAQYVQMYRYGFQTKEWIGLREAQIAKFLKLLGPERALFKRFFNPGIGEYGDRYDWQLKSKL